MTVTAKATVELVEPGSLEPTKLVRKYYAAVPDGENATTPRTQTNDRFRVRNFEENVKVVDDIKWKLVLHEHTVLKTKCTRDAEDWTENSARVYHLVLQHCPTDLEAVL